MRKQVILLGMILLMIGCLAGCNQISNTIDPGRNRFVGTWNTGEGAYVFSISFFVDGTCSLVNGISGTWDVKNGRLVTESNANRMEQTGVYSFLFSENNTRLTLVDTSGRQTMYLKQ